MLLASIKTFAKKRAKTKNPASTPSKSVYGGVGLSTHLNDENNNDATPPTGTGGSGDGDSGDGGGGE